MKKRLNIEEEINKTLESVKHYERFEGSPFLHTRIEAKIKSGMDENPGFKGSFVFRNLRIAGFVLIIAINIITLYVSFESTSTTRDSELLSIAEEYEIYLTETDFTNQNEE